MRRGSRGRAELGRAAVAGRLPKTTDEKKKMAPARRAARRDADVQMLFEYASFMEEPLNLALDLTRGLNLVADGLNANDDRGNGQPVLALGRLISGELHQVKGRLTTLIKAARECGT